MLRSEFLFNVRLMSKARPRASRGGGPLYMPKGYMDWKKNLRHLMSEWWTIPPLREVVQLHASFYGPARGDLDNMLGAVLDSGTGVIWIDDRVSVIQSITGRWRKAKVAESRIHLSLIWREPDEMSPLR